VPPPPLGLLVAAGTTLALLRLLVCELSGDEVKGVKGVGGMELVVVSGRRRCGLVVRRDMVGRCGLGRCGKLGNAFGVVRCAREITRLTTTTTTRLFKAV
jgi:hypothetical protein